MNTNAIKNMETNPNLRLEAVLDREFPFREEEGEKQHLSKRGEALILYDEAVKLIEEAYGEGETKGESRIMDIVAKGIDKGLNCDDIWKNILSITKD